MRTHLRRAGIAVLVASLVTSLLSTTQAGVIPWLYDAIFGPVYPNYYSGYAAGWAPSGGCAPSSCAPCNPCRVSYAPRISSPCASGTCSTTAFYGPCGTRCSTTLTCNSASSTEVGKLAPEPADLPPAPAKTFDETDAKPATRDVEHSNPTVSGVAAPDGKVSAEDTGFGAAVRDEEPVKDGFAPPVIRPEEGSAPNINAPAASEEIQPGLNLDNRSSWNVPVSKERIGMRAGFRNARIARHAQPLNRDYVIPLRSATQIAGK
ncbi:hypothetical protein GC176_16555 [bacterium]|nr:hypothetical protein [bacterium]